MLKRIDQAEAYISHAQWIMLKTQHECPDSVRSAVQRKLGLLYAAKGEYQAALECLAQDVRPVNFIPVLLAFSTRAKECPLLLLQTY